jgi:hypothetical protein
MTKKYVISLYSGDIRITDYPRNVENVAEAEVLATEIRAVMTAVLEKARETTDSMRIIIEDETGTVVSEV